jgi:hypothetical protein
MRKDGFRHCVGLSEQTSRAPLWAADHSALPIMNERMSVERGGARLIHRAAWLLATTLIAAPLTSIFHQPVGWGPRLVVIGLAVTAAFRPFDAWLMFSGLGPFAATILALTRSGLAPLNFLEAVVLALLLGCAARRGIQPQPLAVPPRFGAAAAALLSIALAALVTSAVTIWIERPDTPAVELLTSFVLRDYLVGGNPLTASMLFAEGVALMLLAGDAGAADPDRRARILRMMVGGAAAAAMLNLLRIINSALPQPHPWSAFLIQLATVRANMHFPDLNAAGSYFALMLFIALGLLQSSRVLAVVASLLIGTGVWMSGSRTALAAVLAMGIAGALTRPDFGRRRLALSVAVVTVLALLAFVSWGWYPQGRNLESMGALSYRVKTGKAAVNLITTHPAFGVGPGNLSGMSEVADNAHNNYLQIAAELGLPALALFVYVSAFAVRASRQQADRFWLAWGLTVGLVTYLVTCLAGHPLLVGGAAYPFWMALGLAASFGSHTPTRARIRWAGIAALVIVAVTLPWRIAEAARDADVEHVSVGLSKWQQQPDGSRYRWAGGRATFFVSPSARSIRIPLKRGAMAPAMMEIRIYLDGVEANRVILRSDEDEQTVRLNLIRRAKTRFARIDLESRVPGEREPLPVAATEGGGLLMVGRPIPETQ